MRLVAAVVALLYNCACLFVRASVPPDFRAYVKKYGLHPRRTEFGEQLSRKEYTTNVYFIRLFNHDTVKLKENVKTGMVPIGDLMGNILGVRKPRLARRLSDLPFDASNVPTPAFWNDIAFDWRDVVEFPKIKHQKPNECFAETAAIALDALYQNLYPSNKVAFFNPDLLLKCAGHSLGETGLPDEIYSVHTFFSPTAGCHATRKFERKMTLHQPVVFCDLWGDTRIEQKIMSMLKIAPVAVGIESTNRVFRNYKSGILSPHHIRSRGGVVDHAVSVVGFGRADKPPYEKYWTIRNSWGEDWGENGYARVQRFSEPGDSAKGVFNAYAAVVGASKV